MSHTDCIAEPTRCELHAYILSEAARIVAEDIASQKPDLVLIDRESRFFEGSRYPLDRLFLSYPEVAAEMQNYALISDDGDYMFWQGNPDRQRSRAGTGDPCASPIGLRRRGRGGL